MGKEHNSILIGQKIKSLRERKELSVRALAKKIPISDTYLAKIESGSDINISIEKGIKIANALGIHFNELFDIELPERQEENQYKEGVEKLKIENERLNNQIFRLEKMVSLYEEQNEILKPFRLAFIQERTISELMVHATIERMKELVQKGQKIEITSHDIRQAAIALYKTEYPEIELNPYLNLTPGEVPKKQ